MAFLGASFSRIFRDDHQTQDLGPVGDNIPEQLPVFAVDIVPRVDDDPADARDRQDECQRMLQQQSQDPDMKARGWPAALSRADLDEVFGGDHEDQHAKPVGNRIPVERAEMGPGVRSRVQQQEECQQAREQKAERMLSEPQGSAS